MSGHKVQTGGVITVPGTGIGDKVGARVPVGTGVINRKAAAVMLEPGEKLVSPETVKKMGGPKVIHAINRAVPRFAQGGIVALGRKLQKEGYEVGEHPAFGGVAPVHATNSYHYKGMAIDINDDVAPFASGGGEPGSLDKLFARLKRLPGVLELLWRVKDHFDHLHLAMGGGGGPLGDFTAQIQKIGRIKLGGPDSALKAGAQAGLDASRRAANLALEQAAMSPEGAEPGVHLPGGAGSKANRTLGRRMAARYGWIGPEWGALDDLWGRLEGSWDENLANLEGSGAYGIAQALPSSKYPPAGRPDAPPGIKKAQAQIGWGLRYIKERYGDPLAAHAFRLANNYYAKGGVVGYVGDSLGVGTAPYLKGRIGKLVAKVLEGRGSPAGVGTLKGMLGDRFDRYVLDLGTNDPDAGTLTRSLKKADKLTGGRLLMVPTVNGPKAQAKNAAIRGLAGRDDIDLFEWAKRSKGLVGPDGIHAETGGDYSKRAAMLAGALKAATRKHDEKPGKGSGRVPALKGPPTRALRQTLRRLGRAGNKKQTSRALKAFRRKIGKLGLPPGKMAEINRLLGEHERFSEFASRAQGLTTEDEDTGVARLAKVGGLNEGAWLVKDLTVLTAARNRLIDIRQFILGNKGRIESALGLAQKRLGTLRKPGKTPRKWEGLNPARDSIAKWNKQPAEKRKKRMREWHKEGGSLPGDRDFTKDGKLLAGPGRRRRGLVDLVTTLKTQRGRLLNGDQGGLGAYSGSGSGVLGSLFAIQGFTTGDPYAKFATLPPIGTLGGYIGDAQTSLAALDESLKPRRDSGKDEDADLWKQIALEERLRTAVSERQRRVSDDFFRELQTLPAFGGSFATGGVVDAPRGAPRTAVVHGQEGVFTPDQMAAMGGQGDVNVHMHLKPGTEWLRDYIQLEVERGTRKQARTRVLPGQGGGRLK